MLSDQNLKVLESISSQYNENEMDHIKSMIRKGMKYGYHYLTMVKTEDFSLINNQT